VRVFNEVGAQTQSGSPPTCRDLTAWTGSLPRQTGIYAVPFGLEYFHVELGCDEELERVREAVPGSISKHKVIKDT